MSKASSTNFLTKLVYQI